MSELVVVTETVMDANGSKEMTLNRAKKEAKKETRLRQAVAYPGIFFGGEGGVQQIQLRTERTGIWGR